MKELSIEEKAQRYDEAVKTAKYYYDEGKTLEYANDIVSDIFPELKEDEDDSVKGTLYEYFKRRKDEGVDETWYGISYDKILAWLEKQGKQKSIWHNEDEEPQRGSLILLIMQNGTPIVAKIIEPNHTFNHGERWAYIDDLLEKQGEQKSADKVEPKFHEGEWITNDDYTWQVVSIMDLDYVLQSQDGNTVDGTISYVDEHFHSFAIQDAKDGDVLAFDDDNIVIFKDLYNSTTFHSYCHIEDGIFYFSKVELPDWWECEGFNPATEEQRDILFQKMKEAGYEWDAEKKELKKIEDDVQLTEFEDALKDMMNAYRDAIGDNDVTIEEIKKQAAYMLSLISPKQEWSEEDEEMFDGIIADIQFKQRTSNNHEVQVVYEREIDWLKSLKDRAQPQGEQLKKIKGE